MRIGVTAPYPSQFVVSASISPPMGVTMTSALSAGNAGNFVSNIGDLNNDTVPDSLYSIAYDLTDHTGSTVFPYNVVVFNNDNSHSLTRSLYNGADGFAIDPSLEIRGTIRAAIPFKYPFNNDNDNHFAYVEQNSSTPTGPANCAIFVVINQGKWNSTLSTVPDANKIIRIDPEHRNDPAGGGAPAIAAVDIDHDGREELFITMPGANPPTVYVINFAAIPLQAIINLGNSGIPRLIGQPGEYCGWTIKVGFPFVGSNTAAILVTCPYASPFGKYNAGSGYEISTADIPANGTVALASIYHRVIYGPVASSFYGRTAVYLDFNDGGADDIVMCSFQLLNECSVIYSENNPDVAPNTTALNGTNGLRITGTNLANTVDAGDFNGNGIKDLYITPITTGRVVVVFGSATRTVAEIDTDTPSADSFTVTGVRRAVSGGDVNGDGTDDCLWGYPEANPQGGGGVNTGIAGLLFGENLKLNISEIVVHKGDRIPLSRDIIDGIDGTSRNGLIYTFSNAQNCHVEITGVTGAQTTCTQEQLDSGLCWLVIDGENPTINVSVQRGVNGFVATPPTAIPMWFESPIDTPLSDEGPIVAGVVVGLILLIILGGAGQYYLRKREEKSVHDFLEFVKQDESFKMLYDIALGLTTTLKFTNICNGLDAEHKKEAVQGLKALLTEIQNSGIPLKTWEADSQNTKEQRAKFIEATKKGINILHGVTTIPADEKKSESSKTVCGNRKPHFQSQLIKGKNAQSLITDLKSSSLFTVSGIWSHTGSVSIEMQEPRRKTPPGKKTPPRVTVVEDSNNNDEVAVGSPDIRVSSGGSGFNFS